MGFVLLSIKYYERNSSKLLILKIPMEFAYLLIELIEKSLLNSIEFILSFVISNYYSLIFNTMHI